MNDAPSDLTLAVARQLRAIMEQPPSQRSLEAAFRLLAKWRARLIDNTIVKRSGTTVLGGPFAGMDYSVGVTEGAGSPRRLGCYEAALIPVIETIIARGYPLVVDIGVWRMAITRLASRRGCPEHASLRGTRTRKPRRPAGSLPRSTASPTGSRWAARSATAISTAARMRKALSSATSKGRRMRFSTRPASPVCLMRIVLVEVHDCFVPHLSSRIAARFAATHRVTRRPTGASTATPCPPGWKSQRS